MMRKPKRFSQRSNSVKRKQPAFLLLLVMLIVAIASLATLNFSRSMLYTNEATKIAGGRMQARMCAESGAQAIRLFLAYPPLEREGMGGAWSNPNYFQSRNVLPSATPEGRGNYSVVSPALDQDGSYNGIRFGLQNESGKLNLNALVQLDELAQGGALASSAASGLAGGTGTGTGSTGGNNSGGSTGGGNTGGNNSGGSNTGTNSLLSAASSQLASQATSALGSTLARDMLMALPGMTVDAADSILDWLDKDDEPREYGAEVDYYAGLQPPYKPSNGPIESIEQLLLVRGMTPQILYGYDENRNGFIDPSEQQKLSLGIQPGAMMGQVNANITDPEYVPPAPLGLVSYLTLHSQEKNVALDGTPRININNPDLQTLYEDLKTILSEDQASFIIAFRIGGVAQANPLATLASMAAQDAADDGGAMGTQLQALSTLSQATGNTRNQTNQAQPWTVAGLGNVDLSQGGQVQFQQVLDLYDATVNMGQGQNARSFKSPFTSLPGDMATTVPILLDKLTTTDAKSVPGRINIMECPREILAGIPGLTDEMVQDILAARTDGSDSDTRRFEAWLAIEGYVTLEQLRGITPLICCGGDVYKAQIIGYLEGDAAFSRIETIVNGAGDLPTIQFFRRLDHLGRGFSIPTLGQRPDAVILN